MPTWRMRKATNALVARHGCTMGLGSQGKPPHTVGPAAVACELATFDKGCKPMGDRGWHLGTQDLSVSRSAMQPYDKNPLLSLVLFLPPSS